MANASWRDNYDTARFLRHKVVPTACEVAKPLAIALINDANESLGQPVDHKLHWTRRIDAKPKDGSSLEGISYTAAAVFPSGIGAPMAAGLPFMAVSTTAV